MHLSRHSFRPRSCILAGSAIAAASLLWSLSAFASGDASPNISVKVDSAPIPTLVGGEASSYASVVKRVAPSVVRINLTAGSKRSAAPDHSDDPALRQFFGDQPGGRQNGQGRIQQPHEEGLASGVIVSADGYVLTNNHVVQGADNIKVTLNDGREFSAKVVGTDPDADLAVVKIDAANLPAITFANSDKAEVGDRVLAVGNPFGIGQTVTSGVVSGLGRATQELNYEDFIQTDAAINPGNSGGALVDVEGRLIGINTEILSRSGGSQGIGFAIPSNLARNVMEQLVANGKVVRGFLGVNVQDVTPALADGFKLKDRAGALVAGVLAGGPAALAGLQDGDVITSLNGVSVADARHLRLSVASFAPGTKVPAELVREGKATKVELTIGSRPGERAVAAAGPAKDGKVAADEGTLQGVGVTDLDSASRREFGVPANVRGAIVTQVDPDSAAAAVGLEAGDVIQEINRQPVTGADDAIKLTAKSETKKTLLRVWNEQGQHYVIVDETGKTGNS